MNGTRLDTRPSKRGRLGRSNNAKTDRNSEFYGRTDFARSTTKCNAIYIINVVTFDFKSKEVPVGKKKSSVSRLISRVNF